MIEDGYLNRIGQNNEDLLLESPVSVKEPDSEEEKEALQPVDSFVSDSEPTVETQIPCSQCKTIFNSSLQYSAHLLEKHDVNKTCI